MFKLFCYKLPSSPPVISYKLSVSSGLGTAFHFSRIETGPAVVQQSQEVLVEFHVHNEEDIHLTSPEETDDEEPENARYLRDPLLILFYSS